MESDYFKKQRDGRYDLGVGEAVLLWQQGVERWNEEVRKFPDADVDFSGFDFTEYRLEGNLFPLSKISFEKYIFPNGRIDFSNTVFGQNVSFIGAIFLGGEIIFSRARFQKGFVSFKQTMFGKGTLSFIRARFEGKDVSFEQAKFGLCSDYLKEIILNDKIFSDLGALYDKFDVYFSDIVLSEGTISFSRAKFGDGNAYFDMARIEGILNFDKSIFGTNDLYFDNTTFNQGHLRFSHFSFGEGSISLRNCVLDNSKVTFDKVKMESKGDLDITEAKLETSSIEFWKTKFGNGTISARRVHFSYDFYFDVELTGPAKLDFRDASFAGKAVFEDVEGTSFLEEVSFRNSAFENVLLLPKFSPNREPITEESYPFIPDLLNSKISHHVDTTGISIKLKPRKVDEKLYWIFPKTLWGKEGDSQKLMRLKEIAEDHKDHDKALEFMKWEMRAKRWRDGKIWGNLLDLAYDFFSSYGKSIIRPFAWLTCGVIPAWACIYMYLSSSDASIIDKLNSAFSYSISQAFFGLPSTKFLGGEAYKNLFPVEDGAEVSLSDLEHIWVYAENLLAFTFIFLIGLALRNRFRLK